jgi:hypothetical protein
MKTNEKKLSLIGYGLKPSLVMSLNESQINHLHTRMVNQKKTVKEQVTQVPSKPSYKIGDKGGSIPNNPGGKGYAIKQNPDKSITAIPMDEKALSKKQQEFFGVVRNMQKGNTPKKGKAGEAAKEMSKKDVKDFASTKHKGLPKKVETKEGGYMDMIGKASNKNIGNKIADIKPSLKWESILEDEFSQIIENTIFPKMTKKDFIRTILESPEVLPKPDTKPAPTITPNPDFDPFNDPDPSDDPEARNPEVLPKPDTKPAPTITPKPDFDPFDDPDPSDDPEAKSDGFRFFMGQVKKNRMIK